MNEAGDLSGGIADEFEFFGFAAVFANATEEVVAFGFEGGEITGGVSGRDTEQGETTGPREDD